MIEPGPDVTYKNPPPVTEVTSAFDMYLEDGIATFKMKQHCSSEREARSFVEPFLRGWELYTALQPHRHGIGYRFDGAEIIDRAPAAPGSPQFLMASTLEVAYSAVQATVHVTHPEYPAPPKRFEASPDVETMWFRYQRYIEGREPLAGMAYFCVTFVETKAGGQRHVCRTFSIGEKVLRQIARLSTEVGDVRSARKMVKKSTRRPHTQQERNFVEAAVKRLIQRVAEYDADPSAPLRLITMGDLPPL
jgi:hypothetical protein